MADRPAAIQGLNLGLVVMLCLVWLALGLLCVGPGRSSVSDARNEVRALYGRQSDWDDEFGKSGEFDENDRRIWQASYALMSGFGPDTAEEPGLTAWVANQLRAPSVRGLEVSRGRKPDDEARVGFDLHSPRGDNAISLRPISVSVRFYALYEDVVRLLSRIESENNAIKIERIVLKRNAPEVRVELDLALWTREEATS